MTAKGIFAKHVNPDAYLKQGTVTEPTFTITVQTTAAKTEDTKVQVVNGAIKKVGDDGFETYTLPQSDDYADPLPTNPTVVNAWKIVSDYTTTIAFKLSDTAGVGPSIIAWRNQIVAAQMKIASANRTVFMDSNIALTDGTAPVGSDVAVKTIPNLYQAITDMGTRINDISISHGASTADAGLFVKQHTGAQDPYQGFLQAESTPGARPNSIEITPGNKLTGTTPSMNASEQVKGMNMHFRANEITFTVNNPNATVLEAYEIDAAVLTTGNFDMGDPQTVSTTLINAFTSAEEAGSDWAELLTDSLLSHYWVPLEDYNGENGWIGENLISAGSHGKIFTHINLSKAAIENLKDKSADPVMMGFANTALGVLGKHGTVVHIDHATVLKDVACGAKEDDLKVSGEMTYNLGAIIEAIQELNRRTMFMDIDMTFNGAMSYGDYNKDAVDTGKYTKVLDGLPAASNSNLVQHGDAVYN